MKQFILFLLIVSGVSSCTSSPDKVATADTTATVAKAPPAPDPSTENLAVVNKYLTAIEKLDTTEMSSVMADSYRGYGPSIGDSAGKKESLENWKYNFDHYYASIKYDRYQNIASTIAANNDAEPGDWVSNWSYCSIKYKDGKGQIYIWVNSVYKIENGKIIKSRVFYNEADWLRQQGYRLVKTVQKKQGESL